MTFHKKLTKRRMNRTLAGVKDIDRLEKQLAKAKKQLAKAAKKMTKATLKLIAHGVFINRTGGAA